MILISNNLFSKLAQYIIQQENTLFHKKQVSRVISGIYFKSETHIFGLSGRGGSNSIVLQYYCKVLQYFSIATSQNNSISIAKSQSIAILIAKFSSIAKSIANFFKYCK